jgi:hypothetical protein
LVSVLRFKQYVLKNILRLKEDYGSLFMNLHDRKFVDLCPGHDCLRNSYLSYFEACHNVFSVFTEGTDRIQLGSDKK